MLQSEAVAALMSPDRHALQQHLLTGDVFKSKFAKSTSPATDLLGPSLMALLAQAALLVSNDRTTAAPLPRVPLPQQRSST